MRISILADIPWPTGAAGSVRVRRWAEELSRAGCEVTVIPVGNFGSSDAEDVDQEFHTATAARFTSKFGVFGRDGWSSLTRIAEALRLAKPDWILCYGRRVSTMAACVSRRPRGTRIAVDVTEHPSITLWERGHGSAAGWDHWLGARYLLRQADAVFAITPNLAAACQPWTRAPITVVPGMVREVQAIAATTTTTSPKFGYFGGWHTKDAPTFVIRMAARMLLNDPHATFETVGFMPKEILADLMDAGLNSPRTIHHGAVSNERLAGVLSPWALALMPRSDAKSACFAFPNRAADLLGYGVPVAVRESVGIASLGAESGVILVPSDDAERAADMVSAILTDHPRLAEFQLAARRGAKMNLCATQAIGQAVSIMRRTRSAAI
jgi:glycosyltransferase involved in cell wall biosynthesis